MSIGLIYRFLKNAGNAEKSKDSVPVAGVSLNTGNDDENKSRKTEISLLSIFQLCLLYFVRGLYEGRTKHNPPPDMRMDGMHFTEAGFFCRLFGLKISYRRVYHLFVNPLDAVSGGMNEYLLILFHQNNRIAAKKLNLLSQFHTRTSP